MPAINRNTNEANNHPTHQPWLADRGHAGHAGHGRLMIKLFTAPKHLVCWFVSGTAYITDVFTGKFNPLLTVGTDVIFSSFIWVHLRDSEKC
jgi:hypothetical protein